MSQIQLDKETPGSKDAPVLTVSSLGVVFSKQRGTFRKTRSVVNACLDISFDVRESEILCVVGESGSGKTTLAKNIFALSKPTSGSIKYRGNEVTKLKGKALLNYRRDVQMIYQDPFESLNPRHDIYSTLAMPIRRLLGVKNRDKIVSIITDLLKEVELDPNDIMYRYPHQLSGGQRQRVNIARALATNPKLLIADEPITMLDAAQRLRVISLLVDLKEKRHLTVLLVTHDLASAKLVGDRVLVMYRGKLVELGDTREVLTKPQHPYVELIMNSMPALEIHGTLDDDSSQYDLQDQDYLLSASLGNEDNPASLTGCIFRSRCKYATQVCAEKEPPLEEKGAPGHLSACFNPLNK